MMNALVNHLWQSTLFALLAALLILTLQKNSANTRFCLWLAASIKFLIPFSLLVMIGSHLAWDATPTVITPQWSAIISEFAEPAMPMTASVLPSAKPETLNILAVLSAIWAWGFAAVIFRWLTKWLQIRKVVSAAQPLQLSAPIKVMSSPTFQEPGIFGIVRPVLLLPDCMLTQLAPRQFEAILAHELCHVRRQDNLTAAIHMIVEALFWFHPLVWWLGARMMEERERACDEAVIRSGRDPQIYAESILKVCRLYVEPSLPCMAGVAGRNLKRRIEEIMTQHLAYRMNIGKKFLLASVGLAVLVGPITAGIFGSSHVLAQTASTKENITAEGRAQRFAEQAKTFTAVPIDPKLLDLYVGQYERENSIFTISRDGDRLFCQILGQPSIEVFPYSDHEFFQPMVHAQLTFLKDGHEKASTLFLHQNGFDLEWKRVDDAVASKLKATIEDRIKNKIAAPGSEAALRRHLTELQQGQMEFDDLSPQLAEAVREQLPLIQQMLATAGPMQTIAFKGVGPMGVDVYVVKYENANWEWRIVMGTDGKVTGMGGQPQPQ